MAWLYRLPNSCIAFLFGVIGAALFDRAVDIFHRDFSAQIARDVSHKFLRIGVQTSVYDDPHMMLMSASLLGPDDAAIVFSHSGASTAVLEAIALARKQGARTIAVASYAGSPLAEVADVVLVSTSHGSGQEQTESLIGASVRIPLGNPQRAKRKAYARCTFEPTAASGARVPSTA
jgi:RpiR family transcriptional regulator, repressor of rpiB and als operon